MRRANPFRELTAGLTADKSLLFREAVNERRCHWGVIQGLKPTSTDASIPYVSTMTGIDGT